MKRSALRSPTSPDPMCWPDLANLLKLSARLELGRAIRAAGQAGATTGCEVGPDAQGGVGAHDLRRDHIAGGAFIVGGALILAVSGDLPFGTLASPGAGMLPKLVIGLMMAFGLILLLRAGESPPLPPSPGRIFPHAAARRRLAAAAIALYMPLGFLPDHGAAAVRPDLRGRAQAAPDRGPFSAGVTGARLRAVQHAAQVAAAARLLWF